MFAVLGFSNRMDRDRIKFGEAAVVVTVFVVFSNGTDLALINHGKTVVAVIVTFLVDSVDAMKELECRKMKFVVLGVEMFHQFLKRLKSQGNAAHALCRDADDKD